MNEEILPDLGLEVGDKVECHGVIGEVAWVSSNGVDYPIGVKFKLDLIVAHCFLRDGRAYRWHKTTTLKLIEKKINPKIKVTLYRYTYRSKYDGKISQSGWQESGNTSLTIIKTETKEIEIEEL